MPTWEDVKKALENKKYKWRTVRGVAKELDTTDIRILELIKQRANEVIKSSIPAETGEDLYTTRVHYRKNESSYAKLISSLIQSVSASATSSVSSTVIFPKDEREVENK